jgi:hypothetical protein
MPAGTWSRGRVTTAGRGLAAAGTAALAAVLAAGLAGCGSPAGAGPAAAGGTASPTAPAASIPAASPSSLPTAPPTGPLTPVRCGLRPLSGPGGAPQPLAGGLTLTNADNGRGFCVHPGQRVTVVLTGAMGRPWAGIRSDSAALVVLRRDQVPLPTGTTRTVFLAAQPGTAHLTSDRMACPSGPVHCDALLGFHVTVVVLAPVAALGGPGGRGLARAFG